MNHEMAIKIANANNRINSIHEQLASFLQHLSKHAEPEGLPAKIRINDQSVTVNCFGNSITAEPKVVMNSEGLFAVEYLARYVIGVDPERHTRQTEIDAAHDFAFDVLAFAMRVLRSLHRVPLRPGPE